MTELLYHRGSSVLAFDATVLTHATFEGRPSLVLDRTAFYPEAGGQMADRGTLLGLPVIDVQVDDAGVVHHVLDGVMPEVGATVHGAIDASRRRTFMALHTGQHIFSRALVDASRAETVSSRLGETCCTVDLDVVGISDAALGRALDLTHAVIDADVPVRAWFPEAAELATLPLRRAPKVTTQVRVVQIGDFDVSPCGGTHCDRSGQVGVVEVFGVERYKGKVRVTFDAGVRARDAMRAESRALRALGVTLSSAPLDASVAVDRLRAELKDARVALRALGEQAADGIARELLGARDASGQVVAQLAAGDRELVRAVATRLSEANVQTLALACAETDGLAVVVTRGAASTLDAGAVVRRIAARLGGKGGGRADRAEGKVPLGADFVAVAREELARG